MFPTFDIEIDLSVLLIVFRQFPGAYSFTTSANTEKDIKAQFIISEIIYDVCYGFGVKWFFLQRVRNVLIFEPILEAKAQYKKNIQGPSKKKLSYISQPFRYYLGTILAE